MGYASRKKKREAKWASGEWKGPGGRRKDSRKGFHPRLEKHAKESGFKNYASYLASTEWKDKRREVLCRDKWRCSRCEGKTNLQVHHIHYERLGEEQLDSLETLCISCHRGHHKDRRGKKKHKKQRHRGSQKRGYSSRKAKKAPEVQKEKGFVPAWEKPVGDAEWADDLVQRLRDT